MAAQNFLVRLCTAHFSGCNPKQPGNVGPQASLLPSPSHLVARPARPNASLGHLWHLCPTAETLVQLESYWILSVAPSIVICEIY